MFLTRIASLASLAPSAWCSVGVLIGSRSSIRLLSSNSGLVDSMTAPVALLHPVDSEGRPRYKGATFDKKSGRWKATITVSGRRIDLGVFSDAKVASDAYFAAKAVYADEQYASRRKPRSAPASATTGEITTSKAAKSTSIEGKGRGGRNAGEDSLVPIDVAVADDSNDVDDDTDELEGGDEDDDDTEDEEELDGKSGEDESSGGKKKKKGAVLKQKKTLKKRLLPPLPSLTRKTSKTYRGVVQDIPGPPPPPPSSSSSSSSSASTPPRSRAPTRPAPVGPLLWEALLVVQGREISGGEYDTEIEAALAHDALARMYLSAEAAAAVVNFPVAPDSLSSWIPPQEVSGKRGAGSTSPASLSPSAPATAAEIVAAALATGQIATLEGTQLTVEEVLSALAAERGVSPTCISLEGKSSLADHMIIVTGRSTSHMRKMADTIARAVRKRRLRAAKGEVEARDMDDWMVVDCGNIIVNVMDEEAREVFDLEGLYNNMKLGEDPYAGMTYDEWLEANPIPEKWLKRLERDELDLELKQRMRK